MTLNAIIANFQTFKLVDLLDIIIISFLIYQLLGIVNRTRAGQLFKGALLVMAVYLVANTLNMRTVTWLLNSLLQVDRAHRHAGEQCGQSGSAGHHFLRGHAPTRWCCHH